MFAGHFAPALVARVYLPEVALWKFFLACQAVDLLFDVLVPLGVEVIRIHPEQTGPLALELVWMPYSHSLLAGLLYACLCAGVWALGGKARQGLVIGAVLASHWLMDVIVHVQDVPLGWGGIRLGLGLWRWPAVDLAVELGLLSLGALLLARAEPALRPGLIRLVGALCIGQVVFVLGPAPPDPNAAVAVAALTETALVGWAAWLDRKGRGGAAG